MNESIFMRSSSHPVSELFHAILTKKQGGNMQMYEPIHLFIDL
jgi:hypothetical protein